MHQESRAIRKVGFLKRDGSGQSGVCVSRVKGTEHSKKKKEHLRLGQVMGGKREKGFFEVWALTTDLP